MPRALLYSEGSVITTSSLFLSVSSSGIVARTSGEQLCGRRCLLYNAMFG